MFTEDIPLTDIATDEDSTVSVQLNRDAVLILNGDGDDVVQVEVENGIIVVRAFTSPDATGTGRVIARIDAATRRRI